MIARCHREAPDVVLAEASKTMCSLVVVEVSLPPHAWGGKSKR